MYGPLDGRVVFGNFSDETVAFVIGKDSKARTLPLQAVIFVAKTTLREVVDSWDLWTDEVVARTISKPRNSDGRMNAGEADTIASLSFHNVLDLESSRHPSRA
jgi:hypothetical protein